MLVDQGLITINNPSSRPVPSLNMEFNSNTNHLVDGVLLTITVTITITIIAIYIIKLITVFEWKPHGWFAARHHG